MAFGQGVKAGKAFVEFVIDDKRFKRELHTLRGALLQVGNIGSAITAPLLAGFSAAAGVFANAGSQLDDMSKRTGLSVESLSELKFAAEQSGTSLAAVEKAAKELQKNGIDPKRFDAIADSIAGIEDPTQRAQEAMKHFGTRSGTALLPLLKDLPELREQARRLGVTMTTENASAADRLGDAFDATKAQFLSLVNQIGAAVAGPITEFLESAQGVLSWSIEFVKNNPDLVRSIAAVATAIGTASAAALALGAALTLISANPIVLALAGIVGLGTYAAAKFGVFDGVNIPQVAPAMAPRSGVGTAAARAGATQSGDAVRYLRRISDTNDKLVRLEQKAGLYAGNG